MGSLLTKGSSFIYSDGETEKVILDLSDYMKNKSHLPFHSLSGDRTVSDIIVSLMDGHADVGRECGEDKYLAEYTLVDVLAFEYLVQSAKPRRILEIGAGEGVLSYHLGSIAGALNKDGLLSCAQYGLDIDRDRKWLESIGRISDGDKPKLQYMAADSGDTMLESGSFDMVAVNGFNIVIDPMDTVKEAVRAVKSGGCILCVCHKDDWVLFDSFKYHFPESGEYYLGDSGFVLSGIKSDS